VATRTFIESRREMEELLSRETVGYLGTCREGRPYVVPINYVYHEGRIILHCALAGLKLDGIRDNDAVCFTVATQSGPVRRHAEQSPCHLDSESVICYGMARIVEDVTERQRLLNIFNQHFHPAGDEISQDAASRCGAIEIRIAEMTGRRECADERTYWRCVFEP
jgi:nitroimidazol reductase NimA-like FMN-containing flavoprotein (pyridoxamine 5'-phosphate oxidase superfamily)